MAKDAIVSKELAEKFKTEKDTPYLRFVRGDGLDIISAQYVPDLCTVDLKPWPRRGDGAKGVFINHEASRTSNDCYVCEIAPGKKLEPRHHLFEEMIMILAGPRLDHGLEQFRRARHLRMEGGLDLRHPAQLLVPALQRLRARRSCGWSAVTNFPSVMNLYEDVDFVFNFTYDFKNRFSGEPDYFASKGEQDGFLLTHQFRRRRHQPAADHRQGARRRRRPHPLQHGQGLDREPHLAVPGRHLQEGACARAGRARDRALRRRLFADVAGRRGAAALRLEIRHADRAAQRLVPPALQRRRRRRRAISPSSTPRRATARACRCPGSAAGSAATRSTTPTSRRWCARCSPTSSPSTA